MKRRSRGVLFIVLAVLLAVAALLVMGGLPQWSLSLPRLFGKKVVQSSSQTMLVEMRDLFSLNMVEYVYKVVFPHDFLPEDWDPELGAYDQETSRVVQLCSDIGIPLKKDSVEFVVIACVIKGGYDLTNTPWAAGEVNPEEAARLIKLDLESGTAKVRLPETVITEIIIEDSHSLGYDFPDIDISPEEWKKLTDFVAVKIKERVVEEGILEIARQNGEAFIESFLVSAGWDTVVFLSDR